MLRVLLTRRWLAWLAVALVASVGCFFLGRWQWHRWESRHAAQSTIEANYTAPPVPLEAVLTRPTAPLARTQQWRRVQVEGTYLRQHQLLVRNRPREGVFGFQVVLPLRLPDGSALLVDRGWLPNGEAAQRLPTVPPAPSGPVTVTGWLRPGEIDLHRPPLPGQVASINLPLIRQRTGTPLYSTTYLRMQNEQIEQAGSRPAPPRPFPLGEPDQGMAAGVNLSYAIQWWLAAAAFPALVWASARREVTPERPARAKRARIWDDEDQ